MTPDYPEQLKEIITEHAKEVLRVEADPFGKNVDWVKAGNKALAAINALNKEAIGKDENQDPLNNGVRVELEAFAHNQLRATLRRRFGVEGEKNMESNNDSAPVSF